LIPDFLKVNIFFDYLILWGGISLAGMALSYIVLISQGQKIRELEDKIQGHKTSSRYFSR
ncbi:MAG TPA: hypothetical protein VEI28_01685, partial [Thermodesulfovibrionales bacterium]|nr:hypothetical protein [Thermodesulfovibrionales bacterium]